MISIKDGGFIPKTKSSVSYFTIKDPFDDNTDPGHTLRPNTPELEKTLTVFKGILNAALV